MPRAAGDVTPGRLSLPPVERIMSARAGVGVGGMTLDTGLTARAVQSTDRPFPPLPSLLISWTSSRAGAGCPLLLRQLIEMLLQRLHRRVWPSRCSSAVYMTT